MRVLVSLTLLVALAGALGCMGKVLPQSAQAGSTVVIPLGGQATAGLPGVVLDPVGFGGTDVDDPQRGELVYTLQTGSGPVELETRASTLIIGHPGSGVSRGATLVSKQIVSIVDVPTALPDGTPMPLGTHEIDVVRRYTDPATGNLVESSVPYEGELSVLPESIDVSTPNGMETITASSTPFESWQCNLNGNCSFDSVTDQNLQSGIPDPAIRVKLDSAVWAAKLEVTYPSGVIDVEDVYETVLDQINRRATTWFQDDEAGTLVLNAAATDHAFDNVSVVFKLDDPNNAILDPANVSVSVVRAWDQDGNEITSSVGASVGQIF